jgi:hypothetical protein
LLEKLHQEVNENKEFEKYLSPSIIFNINKSWELLNPNNKEDTRSKTVHKLVDWSGEEILKIERGLLGSSSSISPNLIFLHTSELYDGDIIHHYKTE